MESQDQYFRLFDLPVELQVRTMGFLDFESLDLFTSSFSQPAIVLLQHFPSFVRFIFEQFPHMPDNYEMKKLLYRVITISSLSTRPWDRGPMVFIHWLRNFRLREDGVLPVIPRGVQTLQSIHDILDSVQYWVDRLHLSLTNIYGNDLDVVSQVRNRHNSSWTNEHSFTATENYRIRRALLLYHLYCTLFYQPTWHRDHGFNGRISEQMTFLQQLQPFMVAELDGIYGMIEGVLADHFDIHCHVTRRSTPLQPGIQATAGGAKLEHLMSKGLRSLRELFAATPKLPLNPRRGDERYIKTVAGMNCQQNRFFVTALNKCWKFKSVDKKTNSELIDYPTITPQSMRPWRGASGGTNEGSWAYKTFHNHPAGSTDLLILKEVISADQYNWRGIVFWEQERVERHSRVASNPGIIRAFAGQATRFASRMRMGWILRLRSAIDPPDVGYTARQRPESTATFSQYSLLTGDAHRLRLHSPAEQVTTAEWN